MPEEDSILRSAEAALADLEKTAPAALQANVFLIYGDETYYHHRLVRAIRRHTLTPDLEAFNYTFLEHEGATPGAVRGAALTPPMMADHRLVVVRDPADLTGGRRGASRDAERAEPTGDAGAPGEEGGPGDAEGPPEEQLDDGETKGASASEAPRQWATLLEEIPAETRLVLSLGRDLSPSSPLLKSAAGLKPAADVIRCFAATARSAESWVRRMTAEAGGRIDPDASQALVTRSGTSLLILEKEIEKLLTYAGEPARITVDHVLAAATPSAEASVFELVDHIGSRRAYEAVAKLRRLMEQGELPLRLMAMVVRQVRLIFITREMLAGGAKVREVEERLKLPTWVVQGYLTQARNFDRAQLTSMMRDLARIDLDVKTGRQEPSAALELFILRQGA